MLSEQNRVGKDGKEVRIDGRQLKQYRLSPYEWINYGQLHTIVNHLAHGLQAKGVIGGHKVLLMSETRIEWMLSAFAIVDAGGVTVTLFSNLGMFVCQLVV